MKHQSYNIYRVLLALTQMIHTLRSSLNLVQTLWLWLRSVQLHLRSSWGCRPSLAELRVTLNIILKWQMDIKDPKWMEVFVTSGGQRPLHLLPDSWTDFCGTFRTGPLEPGKVTQPKSCSSISLVTAMFCHEIKDRGYKLKFSLT